MKVTKPLKGHENANARVEYTYNDQGDELVCIELISYNTLVATITPGIGESLIIQPKGQYWDSRLYTTTTAKHISWFLKQEAPNISYKKFKLAAERNHTLTVPAT